MTTTTFFNWKDDVFLNPDISVKIRKDTGHTSGILFRFDGTDGYCVRFKDASTIEFGTYNISTGFVQISEGAFAKPLNVWCYLRVYMNTKYLYVQCGKTRSSLESVISNVEDETYIATGRVALITMDSAASFDNFEIGTVLNMVVSS